MSTTRSCTTMDFSRKVTTRSGVVQGLSKKSSSGQEFVSFRGIPYANPPVGAMRFQLPEMVTPWPAVKKCHKCGPDCPQYNFLMKEVIGAEDNCLTLNVYTRGVGGDGDGSSRDGGLLPIVVWIHGGGFSIGSGSDFFYGPYRAMDEPIVLVTINYRLGVLGFATGPGIPANLGLLDQRMAMTWIQANAIVFGGDPNNITLAGESAAILQSGTALCPWASTTEINSISKLTSGTDELRRADAKDLIMMATKAPAPMGSVAFLPSPDDDFLPENPDILVRKWNEDMPIVVGINSNEGAFLAPALLASKTVSARLNDKTSGTLSELLSLPSSYYCEDRVRKAYFGQSKVIDWSTINLLSDAISDSFFTYPLYRLLRQILASSSPCSTRVFAYSYGHRGQFSFAQMMTGYEGEEDLGVSHFDEVLLQFNNKMLPPSLNEKDDQVARYLWASWASFALSGVPGSAWRPIRSAGHMSITDQPTFKSSSSSSSLFNSERMALWDHLLQKKKSPLSASSSL